MEGEFCDGRTNEVCDSERSLVAALGHNEPAGQIEAREMETVRIKGALLRAEELSDDVAVALEQTR